MSGIVVPFPSALRRRAFRMRRLAAAAKSHHVAMALEELARDLDRAAQREEYCGCDLFLALVPSHADAS